MSLPQVVMPARCTCNNTGSTLRSAHCCPPARQCRARVRARMPQAHAPAVANTARSWMGGAEQMWSAGAQQRAAPHLARFLCTAAVGHNKIALGQRLWVGHLRRGQTTDFIMPHSSRRYLTTPQEVAASFTAFFICSTLRNTLVKHVLSLWLQYYIN